MVNNHHNSGRRRWVLIGMAMLVRCASVFAVANVLHPDISIDPSMLARIQRRDIVQPVVAAGKVYLGQPARIRVELFPKKIYCSKVTKVSPMSVEKGNVTAIEVRVSIQNPTGELKGNMSANAELIIQEKHNALLILENAVMYDKDHKTFAEIPVQEAKLGWKKVPVRIGISNGVNSEVERGLEQGQRVMLQ